MNNLEYLKPMKHLNEVISLPKGHREDVSIHTQTHVLNKHQL